MSQDLLEECMYEMVFVRKEMADRLGDQAASLFMFCKKLCFGKQWGGVVAITAVRQQCYDRLALVLRSLRQLDRTI